MLSQFEIGANEEFFAIFKFHVQCFCFSNRLKIPQCSLIVYCNAKNKYFVMLGLLRGSQHIVFPNKNQNNPNLNFK